MINIDTRLMDLVQNQIINTDEFYILLCITKRINQKSQSFPSRATLSKESKFGEKKVTKCINNLVTKGLILKTQIKKNIENKGNRFSSNLYTINTKLLSVFINALGHSFADEIQEIPVGHFEPSGNEPSGNDPLSINQSLEVLNNSIKVKKINKKEISKKDKIKSSEFLITADPDFLNIQNPEVRELLESFWTDKKGARNQKAFVIIVKTLNKMSIENQIKSLEQAITGDYKTIFEITDKPFNQSNTYKKYSSEPINTSTQEIEAHKRRKAQERLDNQSQDSLISPKLPEFGEFSKTQTQLTSEELEAEQETQKEGIRLMEIEAQQEEAFQAIPKEELNLMLKLFLSEKYQSIKSELIQKAQENGLTLSEYMQQSSRGIYSLFRSQTKKSLCL